MKYTTHIAVIAYTCLFASLAQAKEKPHTPTPVPVVANLVPQHPLGRGGARRMNGGTESNGDAKKKDNGGYVPPNHGGPDAQFPHGTGTR